MNGYQLTRRWFNFAFDNSKAKVQHTALYCWMVELNNRLGWKDEFTLNTQFTMEGLSIGNKNTYLDALNDLETWGFIKTIRPSINQNYGRIITLRCGEIVTPGTTPMDIAMIQQNDGNDEGGVPLVKPSNNEQLNSKPIKEPEEEPQKKATKKRSQFIAPTIEQVEAYFLEQGSNRDLAEKCFFHYKDLDWHNKFGKKLSNWKSTMKNNWILKNQKFEQAHDVPPAAPTSPQPKAHRFHETFNLSKQ